MSTKKRVRSARGFTITEMLIAALIMSIVATAGFRFYSRMHMASMAQDSISELQHRCRNTMRDVRKTLRLAGFELGSHVPYRISGDTLAIYHSLSGTTDSVVYYLEEFNTGDYLKVASKPNDMQIYKLMKRTGAAAPVMFSDYISSMRIVPVNARVLTVTLTVQAERADDKYAVNSGFRTYTLGERITLRNVN
jgi:prepilin-type N-terminal cleavage/methylation domain-containing protein